jgi:8-oxo-dGTP pyrophosphatase MutT (NUDIX family)
MKTETSVCVVYFRDKILFLKRKKRDGDPWSGDMCFPGGFLKGGEDHFSGALRELREETGIEKDRVKFVLQLEAFHPVRFPQVNVYPFVFEATELCVVRPDVEIERGQWYEIGHETIIKDDDKGEHMICNGDIIWGLTYRIYKELKSNIFSQSQR